MIDLNDLRSRPDVYQEAAKNKGIKLDAGYVVDLIYDKRVIVELKAVERVIPVHEAQLLIYMRLTGIRVGLLINFNAPVLKDGIYRRVL